MDSLNYNTPVEKFITLEVPIFQTSDSFEKIKKHLTDRASSYREISYVYFTDANNKLEGFYPIQQIFEHEEIDKNTWKGHENITHCFQNTSIERAVSLALHNNLIELPVIDKNRKLVGVLTSDSILSMASKMFEDKTYKHGGIVHSKPLYDLVANGSVSKLVFARMPWLVIGAVGGAITARFVGFFEGTLEQNIVLALYIPAVVYMSDAVGTQTETLFIRTLAMKEGTNTLLYALKDFCESLILGSVIGIIFGATAYLWKQDFIPATIVALTMLVNVSIASPVAILIPTVFRKLKMDPAIGSGPIATIIQDILSLVVYFLIATAFLK